MLCSHQLPLLLAIPATFTLHHCGPSLILALGNKASSCASWCAIGPYQKHWLTLLCTLVHTQTHTDTSSLKYTTHKHTHTDTELHTHTRMHAQTHMHTHKNFYIILNHLYNVQIHNQYNGSVKVLTFFRLLLGSFCFSHVSWLVGGSPSL